MTALKIIELRNKNMLHLNLEEFKKITTKDDLAERSLAVISIAGAMRKGKSFMLNFFLTYAYNKYKTTKTIAQHKTFANSSLIDGFSHCGGSDRHTTGIQVWPDIFLHDYRDGKKIAIIFMDTQGTFDYETKFCDCVSIFALSTLLSSTQIYNIGYNIQNDHLQYLALFVEYAKLALAKISPTTESTSPFDALHILVRDWNFPYDAEYGLAGGKKILDKTFSSSNSEVKRTVLVIKDAFKTIECCLMPHPGEAVATASRFDGNFKNVNKTFLEQVALLIAQLLAPENVQIKTINGVELKLGNFIILIEDSFEILSKYENIPKPKTIVEATGESHNFKLIAEAIDVYKNTMATHLGANQYLDNEVLLSLHEKHFKGSMDFYENAEKLETFDSEMDEKWKMHLKDLLMREFNFFLILNEKFKPETSEQLQTLIKVVTEQKGIMKQLNERNAQNMLDLINTFREREEENREEIKELTRKFEKSPESGFDFMEILKKIVDVVPVFLRLLDLHKTQPGEMVNLVCDTTKAILGASKLNKSLTENIV